MSDTPRTDLLEWQWNTSGTARGDRLNPCLRHARQLERELCEAKYILRLMVMGLPSRRDWLNPDVEKAARQVCGPIPEAPSK